MVPTCKITKFTALAFTKWHNKLQDSQIHAQTDPCFGDNRTNTFTEERLFGYSQNSWDQISLRFGIKLKTTTLHGVSNILVKVSSIISS